MFVGLYIHKMKKVNGYIYIKLRNGWIQEHRYKVEVFIGRRLLNSEKVHHLDKNKENNSISNLMIFDNQREHMKFHINFDKYGFNNNIRRMIKNRWKFYKY